MNVRVKHKLTFLKTFIFTCNLLLYLYLPGPVYGTVTGIVSEYGDSEASAWNKPDILYSSGIFEPETKKENKSDSILLLGIPEVTIEKSRNSFFNEDKKISTPDSLIREVYANSSLGELISAFTPAYVNTSGGAGASSSVFFRGTNSYQTTVSWNGFVLNSVTLGTMDFSAVPTSVAQNISVVHGASGSIAGSGNTGGSVLLENRADWNNRLQFALQSELGTFDSRHFSFSGKTGTPAIQYHLFMFSHQAENNFSYTDIFKNGHPVETIKNNALDNKGLVQNIFFRLPGGSKLEAGFWYQVREKQLPAIMGSYSPATALQRDSTLRVYTKWTRTGRHSSFSLNTAFFDEHMVYRDGNLAGEEGYSLESAVGSSRLMGDANYRLYIRENLSVDAGMTFSSLGADVLAYGQKISEQQLAAITAARLTLPGLMVNASMRKEYHSSTRVPLRFAFGGRKRLPVGGLELKFSFSEQFRVPSFNDKYWQPGGNPNLLPESGYTADAGLARKITTEGAGELMLETGLFKSQINNMILWSPSEAAIWWSPGNKKEVSVNGIESSFSYALNRGRYRFNMGGSHYYARSVITKSYQNSINNEGSQLGYVPRHNISAYGDLHYRRAFAGFTGNFTGSRFTGHDNNPLYKMPSFYVLNAHAGYRLSMGELAGRLQLRVKNLLNSRYQVIRAYPMPGRNFNISLSIEFNQ